MIKIVTNSSTPFNSINWNKLKNYTKYIPYSDIHSINWHKLKEIHILGTETSIENDPSLIESNIQLDHNGLYINFESAWLLVFGIDIEEVLTYLSLCTVNLTILDIRFTTMAQIDLSKMIGIKNLILRENINLSVIHGLELLHNLTKLDLKHTLINSIPDLSQFMQLQSLGIRGTKIINISIKESMYKLKYLDVAHSLISQCDFIEKCPKLKLLNLSHTNISSMPYINNLINLEIINISFTEINKFPQVDNLKNLRSINISYTEIFMLQDTIFPLSLRNLNIEGTKIIKIPENLPRLVNLRRLNLSNLKLESLPENILQLNLEFITDNGYGINLNSTSIKDIDMSLFTQPRAIIEAWFQSHGCDSENIEQPKPLNEVKVVFLGDGGVGKSLTVQRLLINGELVKNFDGNSTPGISITSRYYNVNDNKVLVRFWDFGGQEILHSMHRMFLTRRTLYVVFVNARDNTQDARARYWLQNIKSFAYGSNVLLVLNQIDQNPSASVNEPSLRELYPQLSQIIKMSAQDYSIDQFNESFEIILLQEIAKIPYINEPFLPSWKKLKDKLQNMENYYIDADTFVKMGEECGIIVDNDVRIKLLDWFSDLGISFCYRDNSALSNYMVLRPDWITNAIYIILFNGVIKAKNGLIKHEDIHQILKLPQDGKVISKRVLEDISYSPTETEYVLGVIRKFRLSYRLNDETEFIPMLCDRNEKPIVCEFIRRDDVLEFYMEYVYLPNNVLHRLMVEMRNHLVNDYVWLSGAVFVAPTMGIKAMVKTEDNILKIYIKSENELYPPNVYLGLIRSVIENINESLGLCAREIIVYKNSNEVEEYEYDYLIDSYEHGNLAVYSRTFKKNIAILDILNQTDSSINERRNKLLQDIIYACSTMQGNQIFWSATEDQRNTFIRDILRSKGYYVSDQTLSGESATGKRPGELDIEIRELSDRPWAIFEALNIKGFTKNDENYWNDHLSKLIDNYNPMGLPFSFLVSYLNCPKESFKEIWLKYSEHLSNHSGDRYSLQKVIEHENKNFYVRSAECIYDLAGLPTTVYHICVRLGK